MSSLLLVLLSLLPAHGVSAASASALVIDDDAALVSEFRVYYGKDKNVDQRRQAVLTLEGIDSLGAVMALTAALEDEDYLVRRATVNVLSALSNAEGARWLIDEVLESRKLSKNKILVAGVIEVLGGMGHDFARESLVGYLEDRDLGIRLGAIGGLGRLGSEIAVLPLTEHVREADPEPAEVIAVLGALSQIDPGEKALPAVLLGLSHLDKSVRLAAVKSTLDLRLKGAVRTLITMIDGDVDPRVSEDAFEVLQTLTQRKFEDDSTIWLKWWDRSGPAFEMPDLKKLAEAKKRLAENGSAYGKGKSSFQGIETKSENIVFVIDVSKSMEEPFGDPERLARTGREYKSLQRLAIVKEELINTIQSLPESTGFNIVAYATEAELWKRRASKANVLNKNNASTWVGKLKPAGGDGAGFRARMGLSADSASKGQTNTHLALMTAFGEEVDDKKKSNAFVTSTKDPVDTIFFLTDGEPTVGKTVDMSEIREEVRRVNAYRGVQIHVIYVGAYGGKEFRLLAEENGGVFVSVGG
ncbi:MAG: HEAT repeat protein [Pseudohongiellaceae bacterium]|jgi:HEAT repeat protein